MASTIASRLHPELVEYADALERSGSLSALMDTAADIFADFGIKYFSFFRIPRAPAHIQDTIMAARFPHELFQIYKDRHLFDTDPAMALLPRTNLPFHGREASGMGKQESLWSDWWQVLAGFGIDDDLYMPVLAAGGVCGIVWVGGRNFAAERHRKWALYLLACQAFEHVQRQMGSTGPSFPPLTPREREVVTWTAMGKTAWEISAILHITVRTVNEYAQSARRKLGASNRAHTVAIAMRDHLIEF